MSEVDKPGMDEPTEASDASASGNDEQAKGERVSDRRRVLKLGAAAVPAIATLTPSMAMATYGHGGGGWDGGGGGGAAVSLMMCTVPMPDYVSEDGYPVEERHIFYKWGKPYHWHNGQKKRVFSGPPDGAYSGQQIKDSFANGDWNPPAGVDSDEYSAHLGYLYRVRAREVPGAGLTCLVSLTNNLNTYYG